MRALGASRTSLVPGGVLAGPWVRDPLWRRARAVPSLDLRFADNKSLTDAVTGASLVTFTRNSNGTYTDSAGVLQTAATDVPRFDHNPTTGESLGLLVEEQRTNSITNNTMVGAVAGTPGTNPTNWLLTASNNGISPEIVGTGVEDGVAYVDIRYSGTSTGAGAFLILASTVTAITAATGQSWTGSAYVKLQAGSVSGLTTITHSVNGRTAVGGGLEIVFASFVPTSDRLSVQRRTVSITLANALSERISHTIFNGSYTSGVAIDITLRIGLPQLEQGAFATSPILTSGAAATRNADLASITGSAFSSWYRQDEGTVFVDAVSAPVNNIAQFSYDISNGTSNERIFSRRNASGSIATTMQDNGVTQGGADLVIGLVIPGSATYTSAYSYAANNLNLVVKGSSPSFFTTATLPTTTRFDIGQNFVGTQTVNGTIKRICFWPTRLANSTLQTLTQ